MCQAEDESDYFADNLGKYPWRGPSPKMVQAFALLLIGDGKYHRRWIVQFFGHSLGEFTMATVGPASEGAIAGAGRRRGTRADSAR